MKAISIQEVIKTTLFILLLTFPFFCIGLFAQSSIQKHDELLASEFTPDGPGATVLIAKGDEILYRKAFGMANMELGVEMKPEHVFRLGSITKQFTSVAILKLQEEGKLSVKDPLTKFLPDYPTQEKEILIEHLLTHTSGIKSMTDMPSFFDLVRQDMTPEEVVDFFKNERMEFDPGEGYTYNNSGYFLLGVIIEKITGKSYAEYIEQEIFQPLGMKDSHYDSYDKIIPKRADGYMENGEGLANATYLSTTLPYAAGSLISNVDDMLTWNKAINDYKVISKESLKQAFTPYTLKNGNQIGYAFGWDTGKLQNSPTVQHGGGIFGFRTQGIYFPEEEVYVIVMSNCGCKSPDNIAYKLAAASIGKPFDFKAIEVDPAELTAYEGIYKVEDAEEREVKLKDGALYTNRMGRTPRKILPYAPDQFFYEDDLATLTFEKDTDGMVIAMVAQFIDGNSRRAERVRDLEKETAEIIQVDEKTLQEYAGTYEVGPLVVTFSVEDGYLMGKPQDDSKEKLFPKGEDTFDVRGVGAQIEFHRENGKVIGLTFSQGGRNMKGKKI